VTSDEGAPPGPTLGAVLRASGIDAVYGEALDGIAVTPVASAELAQLLARVHQRVHGRQAAVLTGHLLAVPGPDPERIVVSTSGEVAALPPLLASGRGVEVELAVDPSARQVGVVPTAPPVPDPWVEPSPETLAALAAAERPVVLAGPGVVAHGGVPGLHALAASGHLGVLNTWGAKGVFNWQSRHHLATVGLQSLDFRLGGLPGSDLIVATGLDPDESPDECWQLGPFVDVDPRALSLLAERSTRVWDWAEVPQIRQGLAAVTQEGWADERSPLAPSRVTRNYGAALAGGGRVAADAGTAGFWLARTFGTSELGSAQVPPVEEPGFAAAVALVTRLRSPGRPVLALVDGPPSPRTLELMDLADSLGVGFGVEAWAEEGPALDAEAHLARARGLAVVDRCELATVATAPWQLGRIVDVAGPVVAWGGSAVEDRSVLPSSLHQGESP
jgi:hypothetical protein